MKSIWIALVCIGWLITAILGWSLYNDNVALKAELASLNEDVVALNALLNQQQSVIEDLESRSIESIVDGTSQSLIDTWGALVDSVEKELERAQDVINDIYNHDSVPEPESEEPKLESDDGSERI